MQTGNAKRIFFILLAALTISGFIMICSMGQTVHRHRLVTKTEAIAASESTVYIIREYEGNLGVFKGDSDRPFRTIECELYLLSDYDRNQLEQGIVLANEAELKAYIEDMTS